MSEDRSSRLFSTASSCKHVATHAVREYAPCAISFANHKLHSESPEALVLALAIPALPFAFVLALTLVMKFTFAFVLSTKALAIT